MHFLHESRPNKLIVRGSRLFLVSDQRGDGHDGHECRSLVPARAGGRTRDRSCHPRLGRPSRERGALGRRRTPIYRLRRRHRRPEHRASASEGPACGPGPDGAVHPHLFPGRDVRAVYRASREAERDRSDRRRAQDRPLHHRRGSDRERGQDRTGGHGTERRRRFHRGLPRADGARVRTHREGVPLQEGARSRPAGDLARSLPERAGRVLRRGIAEVPQLHLQGGCGSIPDRGHHHRAGPGAKAASIRPRPS